MRDKTELTIRIISIEPSRYGNRFVNVLYYFNDQLLEGEFLRDNIKCKIKSKRHYYVSVYANRYSVNVDSILYEVI